METAIVYAAHTALWAMAFHRVGPRPVIAILAASTVLSWTICSLYQGNDRVVMMMMLDLSMIVALRVCHGGARDRMVAAISLGMIFWRCLHIADGDRYIGFWTYAAAINCAAAAQFLIAGGVADGIGRSIDHWAGHLSHRLQYLLRMVAL